MKMKFAVLSAVALVTACGQNANGTPAETAPAEQAAETVFAAKSGEYKAEKNHRYITFSYLHQGYSKPYLRWREWDATLDWDAEEPEKSSISVTIDANSIDSGVDKFDADLKSERFFDTANYPEITFESTSVERTGEKTGVITGDLTIKGVTKPASLDVAFNHGAYRERGNDYKIGFSASGVIKRSDFGIDFLVPAVSDEVNIIVEAEFTMPAE